MPDDSSSALDPFVVAIRDKGEATPGGETSPAGATGVMQVLPSTSTSPGFGLKPADPSNPADVRRLGEEYALAMKSRYDGNPVLAAAAYNAGPGRVDQWISQFGDPRTGNLSNAEWAAKIPFDETRNYVARVNGMPLRGTSPGQNDLLPPAPNAPPQTWSDRPYYDNWQAAAAGGNLASYAWANRPGVNDLVPGWDQANGLGGKLLALGTAPVKLLANALLGPLQQGGEAMNRWMAGDQGPDTQRMLTGAVLGTAANALALPKPAGSLGVFGGGLARGANHEALQEAEQLAAGGESPDRVWRMTGWFQDTDKNWKFEIPDIDARFKPAFMPGSNPNLILDLGNPLHGGSTETTLGELLDHPMLFDQYPHLTNVPVGPTGFRYGDTRLGMVDSNGRIGLTPQLQNDAMETLMHEVQHKIQDHEGFATGGSVGEFLPPMFKAHETINNMNLSKTVQKLADAGVITGPDDFDNLINGLRAEFKGASASPEARAIAQRGWVMVPSIMKNFMDQFKTKLGHQAIRQEAFDNYQKLAGEVEARNVADRLAQSRISGIDAYMDHPHATEGYSPEPAAQIVRFGNDKVRLTPAAGNPFAATFEPVDHDPFAGAPTQ